MPNLSIINLIYSILAKSLLFLAVVTPNSLQVLTAGLLVICATIPLPYSKLNTTKKQLYVLYLLSTITTSIYILVGIIRGAPQEAAIQILIIYIISPLLWILFFSHLLQKYSLQSIFNWFLYLTFFCIVSIAIYYYLYKTFGPSSVYFFIGEGANLNLSNSGYTGFTMHVFGSLIFLVGGIFFCPEAIKNHFVRAVLIVLSIVCAFASGRTALWLSLIIAVFLRLFYLAVLLLLKGKNIIQLSKYIAVVFLFLVASILASYISNFYFKIDYLYVTHIWIEKIFSGNDPRNEQFYALLNGIIDNSGIGAGHGIGVTSYISNSQYPWRYELVWVASILRVGFLGALIYAAPFIYYIYKTSILYINGKLSNIESFFLGGFVCAFIASNTNPYIEAFCFQWMYTLPLILLFSRKNVTTHPLRKLVMVNS